MRLTLRTLLAWLDDTLPANEVREIGKQVNESPYAKDLVERISRVTRQRRLTVPSSTGPDATDPNLVANYLDNALETDKVSEYEKLCLTSDVHLAEVASCHQILSLIGQKAKVPPEARHRMYHLVKGREALGTESTRKAEAAKPQRVTAPLPPWVPPEPPKRSWAETIGPPAAVVALILLLAWSTWKSLAPVAEPEAEPGPVVAKGHETDFRKPAGPEVKAQNEAIAKPEADLAPSRPAPESATEAVGAGALEPATLPTDTLKPEMTKEETKEAPMPPAAQENAGTIGKVGALDGPLLRFRPEDQSWDKLKAQSNLKAGDLLVGLDPYRSPLEIGDGRLVLVKDTEVRLQETPPGLAAQFEFIRGRIVLQAAESGAPYGVMVNNAVLKVTPPTGASIGLERIVRFSAGDAKPAPPAIVIYAPGGELKLETSSGSETLSGPEVVRFVPPGTFSDKEKLPSPSWVTETTPPILEQEVGRLFARFFREDQPPLPNLVEAVEAERPEIRRFAVEALGSIGEINLVVAAMNKPGDPPVRLAAIDHLRDILARGGEPATKLHEELVRAGGGDAWANEVEKLLVGFTTAESQDDATVTKLVQLLKHNDVGVRQLALINLMAISKRGNALGYDPDNPDQGDGLKAWQELLQRKEIRRPAETKAAP